MDRWPLRMRKRPAGMPQEKMTTSKLKRWLTEQKPRGARLAPHAGARQETRLRGRTREVLGASGAGEAQPHNHSPTAQCLSCCTIKHH